MNIDFFKSIYNNDTIYHYTKASTAIDFILFHNQLKFSNARKSYDPIESRKAHRSTVYHDSEVNKQRDKQHSQDAGELHAYIDNIEQQFLQVCFCQNTMGSDFASEYYFSTFQGHEELFGFTKLRMWDQYAEHFSGVCIAFSKEKVLSLNIERLELIAGDVKYLTFQDLSTKKIGDIQGNYLATVGKARYKEQLEQMIKESLFCKHVDYSGECEYRIGTLFNKEKCSIQTVRDEMIFDRNIMLDISGCVKAIFVSSFANEKQKKDLLQYAHTFDVEVVEMRWQHDSFEPRNYRKWVEFVNSFEG